MTSGKRTWMSSSTRLARFAVAYVLRSRNMFSVTKEGFVGSAVPSAAGTAVGIGTGGKFNTSGSGFGTCVAIENAGRYTYYVIMIGKTELPPLPDLATDGSFEKRRSEELWQI